MLWKHLSVIEHLRAYQENKGWFFFAPSITFKLENSGQPYWSVITHIPQVRWCEASQLLARGCESCDCKGALRVTPLPVIRIILHNIIRLHAVLEYGHQELEHNVGFFLLFLFNEYTDYMDTVKAYKHLRHKHTHRNVPDSQV